MTDNRRDYLTAFAIGAIVGIGATLLLAPARETGAKRILHELEPALRRVRKKARKRVRRRLGHR